MNFKLKTPKSESSSLILFYVNLPDGSRFVYSSGQKIPVRLWDKIYQIPIKTKSQKDQVIINSINLRLDRIKAEYLRLDLQNQKQGKLLTKEQLKEEFDIHFKGKQKKDTPNDLESCFTDFCEFKNRLGSWSKSTKQRYIMLLGLLNEYQKYKSRKIDIRGIDESWITNFRHYCQTLKKHQVNTLGRNIGLLKTFLNYCLKKNYIDNPSFKDAAVNREVTHQIALNKEEIKVVAQLNLSRNQRLERVRDVFLVGCYTGMRFSDFKRLKSSNISEGLITIREVKDKTKTLQIPITDKVRAILEKYDWQLPLISEQKFREYLKEIFKLAGFTDLKIKSKKIGKQVYEKEVPMYELISTHTARRSFITIMLNSGVPAKAIMSITGHKSINNFQLYYKPTNDTLSGFMDQVWE